MTTLVGIVVPLVFVGILARYYAVGSRYFIFAAALFGGIVANRRQVATLRRGLDQHGMSLVELLVACAATAVLLGGLLTIQQQGMLNYTAGAANIESKQKVRVAIEEIARSVRRAACIIAGTTTSLALVVEGDGTPHQITYSVVGSDLMRTIDGVEDVLTDGVKTLRFEYPAPARVIPTLEATSVTNTIGVQGTDPGTGRVVTLRHGTGAQLEATEVLWRNAPGQRGVSPDCPVTAPSIVGWPRQVSYTNPSRTCDRFWDGSLICP